MRTCRPILCVKALFDVEICTDPVHSRTSGNQRDPCNPLQLAIVPARSTTLHQPD